MYKLGMLSVICFCISISAVATAAQIGDTAPELEVRTWVKGEPVTLASLRGQKLAVVEFWATWCPPCRQSIPHLTELQKKYKEHVVFIGITDEAEKDVKAFVEKMGDKMDYRVAIDNEQKTGRNYMGAFGRNGIPTAFVLTKDGKFAFVGHPMDPKMEEVIKQIIEGKFDLDKAAKEAARLEKVVALASEYFELASQGTQEEKTAKVGQDLYSLVETEPLALSAIAWRIALDPDLKVRDLDLAYKMASHAADLTEHKNGDILDTLARVLFVQGKKEAAVEWQQKALALAEDEQQKQQMQAQLDEFLGKAEQASASGS